MSTGHKKIPALSELQAGYPGLRGLFFDMDGTLFDTENYHAQALLKIGTDHQIKTPLSVESMYELMVGRADHLVYEIVKGWENFPKHWSANDFISEKNRNLLEILQTTASEKYFPSPLRKLIDDANQAGIYVALITSSEKVITARLLEMADMSSKFKYVLTRDDALKVKPDPWPYLKALEVANLDPKEVVIFEDSPVGLQAARASGAHVIKVEWYAGKRP
jgi:beta-phosphoglucomutase